MQLSPFVMSLLTAAGIDALKKCPDIPDSALQGFDSKVKIKIR